MNKILNVNGITCEHCVDTIKEAVGILVGVLRVDVDIGQKQVVVEFDEKLAKPEDLIDKIERRSGLRSGCKFSNCNLNGKFI